jgi:hypothetical protein
MYGTSDPNASECITTRTYGWHRPPRSVEAPGRVAAAARFSSSAAFVDVEGLDTFCLDRGLDLST